ncbi:hypothetical protein XI09_03020 [Bradyrhizobium sp. CCBAU 11386]|nr:hypothetical protein [Bradyrhizobium sp. CCBAU 11386]
MRLLVFSFTAGATVMLKLSSRTDWHQRRLPKPKVTRMMRRPQDVGAAILASSLILAAFGAFFAFVGALAELPDVDLKETLRPMIDK